MHVREWQNTSVYRCDEAMKSGKGYICSSLGGLNFIKMKITGHDSINGYMLAFGPNSYKYFYKFVTF